MLYANDPTSKLKIEATKHAKGICPYCESEMIPKCGAVKIHHWAHKKKECSDSWYEPETQWHLNWKTHFPKEDTEVILKKENTLHIADYFNKAKNYVVEFQNSSLSLDTKIEREMFYPNLIWVINIKNQNGFEFLFDRFIDDTHIKTFRWKHPLQWVVRKFRKKITYIIDEFPGPKFLFKLTDVEHEEGDEFVSVGNDEYYTHYHRVYVSGVSYDKRDIGNNMMDFFDWINDSICQRELVV